MAKSNTRELEYFGKDIEALIREFPDEIYGVVEEAINNMETAIRRKYSEVTSEVTGNLIKDIESDVRRTAPARVVGMVKNKAPHVALVEFGTGSRAHESGKSTGVMPELAPLRKAFDENEKRIYDEAGEKIFALTEKRLGG